jgi:hypothetical protein
VLGVEVNGPQPIRFPVREQAADADREVVEPIAARAVAVSRMRAMATRSSA